MAKVRVNLPYGRGGVLELRVPEDHLIQVVQPKFVEPVADEYQAVWEAIQKPIRSTPLEERVRGARSIAVVVEDITRPTPTRKAIAPLLDYLRQAGVPREVTTILFATGSHRTHTPEEHRYLVGGGVAERYWLVDHRI